MKHEFYVHLLHFVRFKCKINANRDFRLPDPATSKGLHMNDSAPYPQFFRVLPIVFYSTTVRTRGSFFGHLTVVERLPDTDAERTNVCAAELAATLST